MAVDGSMRVLPLTMEVDFGFLRSLRGIVKLTELGTMFVAFVCFAAAFRPKYIAATCMEFVITFSFILLYTLKLNKKITLVFWPLIDVINSLFAAVFILVLSLIAVSTYTVTATLVGAIMGLVAAGLWCWDGSMLIKRITFNQPRSVALSLITFICFVASTAAAFVTAPLIEFLAALFLLFAYCTKFNERFKGFHFPLMDFLRCVSAAIIFFIISIISVSKYTDGASKAAGVFGFIATIVFALDFYVIFNDLASFLKQAGDSGDDPPQTSEYNDSDSDSD
ncbi:uncharacterized protein LOC105005771 isoform X1 [Esox lucius]|uniref:MARVEL domain-containing protein n=1 Tax=Esox lucius TaxID=8010 RepID=A0A3P8ZT73_ESOLU|nr:uncharacterized protein LOC105005771 isoform X1 [Esox lucius]